MAGGNDHPVTGAPRAPALKPRLLVIDDERQYVDGLCTLLTGEGYEVEGFTEVAVALERWAPDDFDAVITDLKMPGTDGLAVLERVRRDDPTAPVIVVTAFASVDTALASLKAGAFDYITKPFNLDEILLTVRKAVEHRTLKRENLELHREIEARFAFANLVGTSPPMQKLFTAIRQIAGSPATVLISGESGTGKELVARALHFSGPYKETPFVVVNCGAIPRTLMESELFGHERGAFTGAVRQHRGYLEKADGGAIFLDEIGELPLDLQVKLLRVLEGHEFCRVGGGRPLKVAVRVIAATNRDLAAAVKSGEFRADLFFRLNVIALDLPPLRDRREDIPLLIHHFLGQNIARLGTRLTITPEAEQRLREYNWPGNVRELQNVIERMSVLSSTGAITVAELPETIARPPAPPEASRLTGPLRKMMDEYEKQVIQIALRQFAGNQNAAATALGVSRQNLHYKLKKHGLESGVEVGTRSA